MSAKVSLALGFSGVIVLGGLGLLCAARGSNANPPSVGPWDYPDAPNNHRMRHPGPELSAPPDAAVANNYSEAFRSGPQIRLIAIGKGNSQNPEHLWSPNGGLFDGTLNDFDLASASVPDQSPATDGRRRELFFALKDLTQPSDVEAFVPGSTPSHLDASERLVHGWSQQTLPGEPLRNRMSVALYVDDRAAKSVVVGIAKGPYRTLASFPNSLGPTGPYLHRVVGSGSWGMATVTAAAHEYDEPDRFDFRFQAHSFSGPDNVRVEITPPGEPGHDELALVGLDATGVAVTSEAPFDSAVIARRLLAKIARFEVRARPFEFVEFKDVKFDPDPRLWRDVVYGPNEPVTEAVSGAVKVRLTSLSPTRDGTGKLRSDDFVASPVLTPTGKIWRDRPQKLLDVYVWRFANPGMAPERTMPRPWIATLDLSGFDADGDKAQGRIVVGGSNSPIPGKDFHPESNVWPNYVDQYGYFQPLPESTVFPFSNGTSSQYVQFKIDTVQGPWTSFVSFAPPLEKIARQKPEYRDFTFTIGPDIRETFLGKDLQQVSLVVGRLDLSKFQTRVVAHLKSGGAKVLRNTSFDRSGESSALLPGYDFGLDSPMPIGDFNKIPLEQITALEIQTRPIHTGYLVQKLPELGLREMATHDPTTDR